MDDPAEQDDRAERDEVVKDRFEHLSVEVLENTLFVLVNLLSGCEIPHRERNAHGWNQVERRDVERRDDEPPPKHAQRKAAEDECHDSNHDEEKKATREVFE